MKKKIGLLSISLVLIMSLFVACPTDEETNVTNPDDNTDPAKVTVTFNMDGGSPAFSPITIAKGAKLGGLYPASDPTKTGFVFGGWFSGALRLTPDTAITVSITVKAKWIDESDADYFTVTFNSNGGSAVAPIRVLEDGYLGNQYPIPTHSNPQFVFMGWFYNLGGQSEEEVTAFGYEIWGNISVTAKWGIPDVTVTFNTDGGTPATITSITLTNGTAIGAGQFPADPTKSGNIFRGWYKTDDAAFETPYTAETLIFGNTALKARWVATGGATLYTVTFDKNNTDPTGATDVGKASVQVPANDKLGPLPVSPTRSEGWGLNVVLNGWNTEADGTGDDVDSDFVVTEDITVYAQWKFVPGTWAVDGETLVHSAPVMGISGTANDEQGVWVATNTQNQDGSVTYSGGAVRYEFPKDPVDAYQILNPYDFFTVHYIAKNSEGTSTIKGSALKQYDSASGLMTTTGDGAPDLEESGELLFDIRDVPTAAVMGFAIQNISDAAPTRQTNTIKWTKVVFSKGERVQITFNTGTEQNISPITGVIGTAMRTLPLAVAPDAANGAKQYHYGWKDASDNAVTKDTIVTGPMALTAVYKPMVPAAKWKVKFNDIKMMRLIGPDIGAVSLVNGVWGAGTAPSDTEFSGYKFVPAGRGWENSQVAFKVTLPADTPLSAYSTVTARVQQIEGGDAAYKGAGLLAGSPGLPATFGGASPIGSQYNVNSLTNGQNPGSTQAWQGNQARTMTYTIDAAKAAAVMGETEICIYWHFPLSDNTTPRAYTVFDVTFNP